MEENKEDMRKASAGARKRRWLIIVLLLIACILLRLSLGMIGGSAETGILGDRLELGLLSVSSTTVTALTITVILAAAMLLVNRLAIPRFSVQQPSRFQQVLEIICEYATSYARVQRQKRPRMLSPYVVLFGVILVFSALMEVVGFRSPLVDWNFFVALVICLLINLFVVIRRGVLSWIKRSKERRMEEKKEKKPMSAQQKRRLLTMAVIVAAWAILGLVIGAITGPSEEGFDVAVQADRLQIGALNISSSTVTAFTLTVILAVVMLLINRLVIPKFSMEHPSRFQQVLEIICDYATSYAHGQTEAGPHFLPPYIIAVGAILVCSALTEALGFRSPAADLNFTFGLALMTFLLINIFAIAKKGVRGRVKSWAQPIPVVFPIRILSDIATPISLACRLFGNILGGMIVVELIYHALGSFGIGIPAVLGLYFNAFHPLIQAYIFITLSLSFIQEAYE